MRIIKKKLSEYAELTGYLHELHDETDNIKEYPAIIIFPGGGFRMCSFLESEPIALAYLAEGYQAFTLKYTTVTDKEDATIEDPMSDAQKALAFIQPDVSLVVNIKESADEMVRAVEATGTEVSDFNKGNIKARSRMIAQYALAGARSGAVIGTDHAAENITGFFTKFGDGGADILPLFRLNKRQGKQLLKSLGADPALYEKIPTADLEEEKPGIADEVALGVTYNEIDDYLEGKQVSPEAQATIEKWWYKGQHKRHLPITVFDHFWE